MDAADVHLADRPRQDVVAARCGDARVRNVERGHVPVLRDPRDPDRLETRSRLDEGPCPQRTCDPDPCMRRRDHTAMRVDDEEGDSQVAGRIVGRAWNQRDALTGAAPQRFERSLSRRASLRKACVRAAAARKRDQRKGGKRSAHIATLDLAAVVHAVRQERKRRQKSGNDQNDEHRDVDQPSFRHVHTSFHGLEANVLQRVRGQPVEAGRSSVVAALGCEIALRHPRRGTMARG